jgi:protein TonB
MHTATRPSGFDNQTFNQTLVWALALSISLHIFAAIWLPNLKLDSIKVPELLNVELAPPKAPEPLPVAAPEPLPEPPKPNILPKLTPKLEPKRMVEPPPSYNPPEPVSSPTPPAVITATPKAETPPAFTTPPPEPPKPNDEDLDAARSFYSGQLTREIARHKQYPKIAQMRGWQGEVQIDLHLDGNGNVLSSKIGTSSGHETLDNQALEMVKKVSPFPAPPDVLRGRSFNILVPVSFRLE